MIYTVRISDSSPQATIIINMLRALAKDYHFLQITEDANTLAAEQDILDAREWYNEQKENLGNEVLLEIR